MKDWDGQSPPTFKHQKGKPISLQHALGKVFDAERYASLRDSNNRFTLQNIPYFGEYQKLREQKIAEINANLDPLDKPIEVTKPALKPLAPVPMIKNIIGKGVKHIVTFKDLDVTQQVVALIDDVCPDRLRITLLRVSFVSRRCTLILNRSFLCLGYVYKLWQVLHGVQRFRLPSDPF